MTRQELYQALTDAGIMLDPCNLDDVNDGSIYYCSIEELQAIYNDLIAGKMPTHEVTDAERVNVRHEAKHHDKYVLTWYSNDAMQVYSELTHDLISKKICSCSWIQSIKRKALNNGYTRIIVQYEEHCRRVYTIADR